jgi:hypothetical protein
VINSAGKSFSNILPGNNKSSSYNLTGAAIDSRGASCNDVLKIKIIYHSEGKARFRAENYEEPEDIGLMAIHQSFAPSRPLNAVTAVHTKVIGFRIDKSILNSRIN